MVRTMTNIKSALECIECEEKKLEDIWENIDSDEKGRIDDIYMSLCDVNERLNKFFDKVRKQYLKMVDLKEDKNNR